MAENTVDPLEEFKKATGAVAAPPSASSNTAPPIAAVPSDDPLAVFRRQTGAPVPSTSSLDFAAGRVALPSWAAGPAPPPPPQQGPPAPAPAQPAVSPVDFYGNPIDANASIPGPVARIGQAAVDAYNDNSNLLTPWARGALAQSAVGRSIYLPALDILGTGWGAVNAAGGALNQGAYEAGSAVGGPSGGRDAVMAAQMLPVVKAGGPSADLPVQMEPPIRNSAMADANAAPGFAKTDASGLTFSPDMVNTAIDSGRPATPRELAKEQAGGRTVISDQQDALDAFKDKPLTIQQYQGLMQGIGRRINDQITQDKGVSDTTVGLMRMRDGIAKAFEGAGDDDITGGDVGDLQTFKDANTAFSQARKMELVERMQDFAQQTDNPSTSFRAKVRAFTNNQARTAGWSDDEISALKAAADRGSVGDFINFMGSKFTPIVAGAVSGAIGAAGEARYGSGGLPAGTLTGMAASGAGYIAGAPFRAAVNAMQRQRMRNALDIMGQSVPPAPLDFPTAGPTPSLLIPPPLTPPNRQRQ